MWCEHTRTSNNEWNKQYAKHLVCCKKRGRSAGGPSAAGGWRAAGRMAQEDEPQNFKHSPGKVVPLCDEMA